jgi:flagellar hook-basal body complex protein FliE
MVDLNSITDLLSRNKIDESPSRVGDKNLDFMSVLKDSIDKVNTMQHKSEEAITSIATGSVKDLHQAAITIDKAEISMKMMLEVRNKALSAYKEILRTQV